MSIYSESRVDEFTFMLVHESMPGGIGIDIFRHEMDHLFNSRLTFTVRQMHSTENSEEKRSTAIVPTFHHILISDPKKSLNFGFAITDYVFFASSPIPLLEP